MSASEWTTVGKHSTSARLKIGLERQRQERAARHDQMGFDIERAQELSKANAVDRARTRR